MKLTDRVIEPMCAADVFAGISELITTLMNDPRDERAAAWLEDFKNCVDQLMRAIETLGYTPVALAAKAEVCS